MANERGQSPKESRPSSSESGRGGMFVVLAVLLIVLMVGPAMYRDRHPRPQIRVDNQSSSALSILHEGDTSGVEAGKTLEFRCEVGQSVELVAVGAAVKKSVFVVVPAAPDKKLLTLEARVDRDGVLSAGWK